MSRIGKQPVAVPDKVKVAVEGSLVRVEGPLGKLEYRVPASVKVTFDAAGKQVRFARVSDAKPHRQLHGLARTLVRNMILGVTKGYRKELEVVGVGYNVKQSGNALDFQVGFANTIRIDLPPGIKAEVMQPTNPGRLAVSGCDKQAVGQVAARIRAIRPPEPYQGKGIRYLGEEVRRKAGKALVGAGG